MNEEQPLADFLLFEELTLQTEEVVKASKSIRKKEVRERCMEYKDEKAKKRRQGYKERKREKMREETKEMSYEERRKYQKGLKKVKKDGVIRLEEASQSSSSPKIIIDLSYSDQMELIEKKSLSA